MSACLMRSIAEHTALRGSVGGGGQALLPYPQKELKEVNYENLATS